MKYYQSVRMLRAAKPRRVVQGHLVALHLEDDGWLTVLGETDRVAICRDHNGYRKEFARLTAGRDPTRVVLYSCPFNISADQLATTLQEQMAARLGFRHDDPVRVLESHKLEVL
jgi:hypothetical protein